MPPRACKKDENQDAIAGELEKVGLLVIDAHEFAQYHPGIADLLVHWGARMAYVEVKDGTGKLTPAEATFQRLCQANGVPYVVLRETYAAQLWAVAFRTE